MKAVVGFEGVVADRMHGLAQGVAKVREEMVDQQRDVLGTLAQRRHDHSHDVQPVEQVVAKAALRHVGLEVARGGRDDADVYGAGLGLAQGVDLLLLEHPRQLYLECSGKLADFVVIDENPLMNLKVLYGTGALKLDENNRPGRVGGVKYTIKDGIVYDASELLDDVKAIVAKAKAAGATEDP